MGDPPTDEDDTSHHDIAPHEPTYDRCQDRGYERMLKELEREDRSHPSDAVPRAN